MLWRTTTIVEEGTTAEESKRRLVSSLMFGALSRRGVVFCATCFIVLVRFFELIIAMLDLS